MPWAGLRELVRDCARVVLGVLLAAFAAYGQDSPAGSSASPQTVVDVLHQLSDRAEIIFAGQVMAVRRP